MKLKDHGVLVSPEGEVIIGEAKEECRKHSLAYQILKAHNRSGNMENLQIVFDALVSPDNNYVSILQTVCASGITRFPVPYVLSNCHNTLCAVGGTINEDDHVFGLDSARKYGGIFVPPYKAVIHEYMREMMAGCGKMILGSDSHTRYGALGTLAIGEGGGEIAKQLLSQTYDIRRPEIVGVRLNGKPKKGVGPMDVALTLIGATFKSGFVKNRILEFLGEGIWNLSMEFRMGIDVMTTESDALGSIWCTDEKVHNYLKIYGREQDYKELKPEAEVYYDRFIELDLSEVECMMALPYHPSNVVSIHEFNQDPEKYLREVETEGCRIKGDKENKFQLMDKLHEGRLHIDQALVSGCSGGLFENIAAMADILDGTVIVGGQEALGIGPASQPVFAELARHGMVNKLIMAGATIRPCICGPCFGVTDVPANNQLSIRHVTRNYPNREGSKPGKGQMAASILMDARSIAATVRNGGYLAAASDLDIEYTAYDYQYNPDYYKQQVYNHYGKEEPEAEVRKGPNIGDWPEITPVNRHLILKVAGVYDAPVTTDDLSPSGDAVAYRSNPLKLATFTMINKDPEYIKKSKAVKEQEEARKAGKLLKTEWREILTKVCEKQSCRPEEVTFGSALAGRQVGDGSSREQAASSQKILGGYADIAEEFATKRYRSNLINWGILPILSKNVADLREGDVILIPEVQEIIRHAGEVFEMILFDQDQERVITGNIGELTAREKEILLEGCLINYNRKQLKK